MSSYSADRAPSPAGPSPGLRLVALTAVIVGVVLLAAAAFALSYAGIHQIALRAGVAPGLARLYPLIFDAMLVVAGAAALALIGARWWAQAYAWASLLLLLAAAATADALRVTHVALPAQPTRVAVAVTPWVLLLLAFGLWLAVLRHFRRMRAAGAQRSGGPAAAAAPSDPAAAPGDGPAGLDALLGPRDEGPPTVPGAGHGDGAAGEHPGRLRQPEAGHDPDPVSYGEETGYVHPDSYLDRGDYSGPGGPGQVAGAGDGGQRARARGAPPPRPANSG